MHVLHSNFAMGSLEIWIAVLIFRKKTGGWGNTQQSENSHFAQDNSRIVQILTLRRTDIRPNIFPFSEGYDKTAHYHLIYLY